MGLAFTSPSLEWKALEPGDHFTELRGIRAVVSDVSKQLPWSPMELQLCPREIIYLPVSILCLFKILAEQSTCKGRLPWIHFVKIL